jgi:hypothetical protein
MVCVSTSTQSSVHSEKLRAVHKKCLCRRTKNIAGTKIIDGDGMLLLRYRRVILWIGRTLRCPTKSPMARSDQGV